MRGRHQVKNLDEEADLDLIHLIQEVRRTSCIEQIPDPQMHGILQSKTEGGRQDHRVAKGGTIKGRCKESHKIEEGTGAAEAEAHRLNRGGGPRRNTAQRPLHHRLLHIESLLSPWVCRKEPGGRIHGVVHGLSRLDHLLLCLQIDRISQWARAAIKGTSSRVDEQDTSHLIGKRNATCLPKTRSEARWSLGKLGRRMMLASMTMLIILIVLYASKRELSQKQQHIKVIITSTTLTPTSNPLPSRRLSSAHLPMPC